MMKDFPSCFGENGVQIVHSASNAIKSNQNLVTCLYQAKLGQHICIITITWSKHMMGQCLSIGVDDSFNKCLCKLDIKPSLFSKWKGSKSLESNAMKISIFWDLSNAKFGSGLEPLEGFYVAILFNHEIVLLLGNMIKEAETKANASPSHSNAIFVAKKEHIFGKKVYRTKVQFCDDGKFHDVSIECETLGLSDPSLEIRIDKKRVLQVKRLGWKFRGNQTISIDGNVVEVFWDVFNWLFGEHNGNAVFMFHSFLSHEKASKENRSRNVGFSLILYAWKND